MKVELRQKMMVCIRTLEKLNGRVPGIGELRQALGNEYAEVLAEFVESVARWAGNAK